MSKCIPISYYFKAFHLFIHKHYQFLIQFNSSFSWHISNRQCLYMLFFEPHIIIETRNRV